MNIKRKTLLLAVGFIILAGLGLQGFPIVSGGKIDASPQSDSARSMTPYFTRASKSKKSPDADGFIQRWLLLEPISKPNPRNNVFTDSYVRTAFTTGYFPNQFTGLPEDGEKVKVGEQELTWHALESTNFIVRLFRFAYGLDKQHYGVLFWAVTVVNSPHEMKNVRMAVGSNSGSVWWLNSTVISVGNRNKNTTGSKIINIKRDG